MTVRGDRGMVLFEVLVALTILAVAGLAIASAVGQASRSAEDLRVREGELRQAEQVLTRLALRDRHNLDLRIGQRREGRFITDVQRPRRDLYRLAVADSAAPELTLLVTAVYRPEGE